MGGQTTLQRPGPCLSWDGSAPLNTIEGLKPLCQGFSGGPAVKSPAASAGAVGSIPGTGNSLEKEMATHSSILAWEVPQTEEPGGLQSVGLQRVGHG